MTPLPVPQRWLAALLGIALLLDLVMLIGGGANRSVLALPGATAMAVCAWFGVSRPAIGATLGALTLTVSSVLLRLADVNVPSVGLTHIMLSELVSGTALVVLVVWRSAPSVAVASVTALVVSCVAAIVIRLLTCWSASCFDSPSSFVRLVPSTDIFATLVFGFGLLVAAVATGLYLRRTTKQRVETEMSVLIRKQWPLGGALALLVLLELTELGDYTGIVSLAGSVAAGVCAFFAPKYPLRNAVLAAGALVFAGLADGVASSSYGAFSISSTAACMALVAYLVRYVQPKQAAWGTVMLAGALVISMAARSGNALDNPDTMFITTFLLLVGVATGWYFRARDRERNQTVKAAVTSAQQGERMALARELHDVVAHHVTGIVVQAQAALMVAGKNPDVALPALERIERSGTEALTAMRTLVGSLRDGSAAWTAGTSDATEQATTDLAADIHGVVENFTGPRVGLDLRLPPELPHEMGRSVLRLVQESLTNVGKHAPDASAVTVRVATVDDTLHIRISDDGSKRPANPAGGSGGYGLVGMRERVELLGGRFEAGPSGYVGWSVEAWLPMRKDEK
jgi:signal transduction histidine kinase